MKRVEETHVSRAQKELTLGLMYQPVFDAIMYDIVCALVLTNVLGPRNFYILCANARRRHSALGDCDKGSVAPQLSSQQVPVRRWRQKTKKKGHATNDAHNKTCWL